MLNCDNLSQSLILATCEVVSPAIEAEIYVVNTDDIDRSASAVSNGVCSSFVLKTGKNAYKITSHDNSFEADATLNVGTYVNGFVHKVVTRVFAKSQDIKDGINALANQRVTIIVKNSSNANDATKYEIYGYDNGMKMSELTSPTTDADGIIHTLTFQTKEPRFEAQLPLSFYATDLEATEAALEALLPSA